MAVYAEVPGRLQFVHTSPVWDPDARKGDLLPCRTRCGLAGAVVVGVTTWALPPGEMRSECGNCVQAQTVSECPTCHAVNTLVFDQSNAWADYERCSVPDCTYEVRYPLGD